MEVRKIRIGPEDEARLRELLRIHEAEIDSLSDEQLDVAEDQTSERLVRLLNKQGNSNTKSISIPRSRSPWKAGTVAFLAAAAAVLFVQSRMSENESYQPQLVTKGITKASRLACESSIVESDGTTPDFAGAHYLVKADKSSYLKLHCGQPVYVHVGFMKGELLHLEMSNLSVSVSEKVVMNGIDRVDFTSLVRARNGLAVLVTDRPLNKQDLNAAERSGYWLEEVPLKIKR
ncbi:hypothetical protein [Oligoflexus tunisiensis]|uniref:hypothetical protein n=1 Tax=Oligoflexus tunisiensis TaxID=708132 RepID=UPI00114CED0B|nr:hypothetical protein [Oligoflexus tunisiensis]